MFSSNPVILSACRTAFGFWPCSFESKGPLVGVSMLVAIFDDDVLLGVAVVVN